MITNTLVSGPYLVSFIKICELRSVHFLIKSIIALAGTLCRVACTQSAQAIRVWRSSPEWCWPVEDSTNLRAFDRLVSREYFAQNGTEEQSSPKINIATACPNSEMLDLRECRWHNLPDMTYARSNYGMTSFEQNTYVAGGLIWLTGNLETARHRDTSHGEITCDKFLTLPYSAYVLCHDNAQF